MKVIQVFLCILVLGCTLTNCTKKETLSPKNDLLDTNKQNATVPDAKMTHYQQVEYGKHLVEIALCNDCHTPKIMTDQGPVPDPKRLLSGHPSNEKLVVVSDPKVLQNYVLFDMNFTSATGPWGTSFAGNLSPDETGLGNWTFENFERALREGKFKGLPNGRPLLPPMPWQSFKHLSNNDIAAIWAYLQSIPPVKNVVPAPIAPS